VDEEAIQDDEEVVLVQANQENVDVVPEVSDDTFPVRPDSGEHGLLVNKILEAQKELEDDSFSKKGSNVPNTEIVSLLLLLRLTQHVLFLVIANQANISTGKVWVSCIHPKTVFKKTL